MSRNSARRALTLVEVLIGLFVFGLFTTLVATAIVMAYKNHVQIDTRTDAIRKGTVGFDKMEVELQTCVALYNPDPTTAFPEGATFSPTPAQPLRFAYSLAVVGNPTHVVSSMVAYRLNGDRLERVPYDASGNPYAAELVATPFENFTVTRIPRDTADGLCCLGVQGQVATQAQPWTLFFQAQVIRLADNQ